MISSNKNPVQILGKISSYLYWGSKFKISASRFLITRFLYASFYCRPVHRTSIEVRPWVLGNMEVPIRLVIVVKSQNCQAYLCVLVGFSIISIVLLI